MHFITYSAGKGNIGGTAPGVPSLLSMSLQGKDVSSYATNPPVPQDPNRTDLTWVAPAVTSFAIDHYEIWRNGLLYATTPDATPSYSDTSATNCVNGTAGSGPAYYTANTYTYQVRTVDIQGNRSALSGTQRFVVYQNGTFNWSGDFNFGGLTANYSDTTGAPQGGTADIKCTLNGAYGGFQPHAGLLTTEWNMWAGAFKYLSIDLKPTITGQTWTLGAKRVGDVQITAQAGGQLTVSLSSYNTPSNGIWTTYKIPLADFLTDWTSGSGVQQLAFYKFWIQDQTGATTGSWYVDNIIFLP